MNRTQRRQILRQYEKYQAACENRWRKSVVSALNRQTGEFWTYAKDQGVPLALSQIDVLVKPQPVQSLLIDIYRKEGVRYADIQYKQYQDRYRDELNAEKAFGLSVTWLRFIQEYILNHAANKVVRITETTKEWIRKYLSEGLEDQDDIYRIVNKFMLDGINDRRANVIVRTETTGILNYANDIAIKQTGLLMEDTWLTSHDDRVRRSHVILDGQTIDHGDTFSNGLHYPGDPTGTAKEVINCRCTKTSEAKRDPNGRLIRTPVRQ